MIVPVVLSGGSGTRLWPLSRKLHPKQLLPLINDTSLLQDTINRCTSCSSIDRAIVICNEEYRFMVAEQVQNSQIDKVDIILEPFGRNTAPAIALAAMNLIKEDPVMLVLPADHDIKNIKAFIESVAIGEEQSIKGNMVTFGIVPNKPETGYGYIKAGAPEGDRSTCYQVEKFIEKPDEKTAKQYIKDGGYYWNSGMFMFKASVYLDALKQHAPEIS